jgi:hypothetical protein
MIVKEFIKQEVEHARKVIKEEMSFQREEDLREFLHQTNEMLDEVIYTHIRDSVKFDIIDSLTGNYYKSMLGNGKQIDYMDLYEIMKRLYNYHHESQEFEIIFQDIKVKVNYKGLGITPSNFDIFSLIMAEIEKTEKASLNVSDFQ